MLLHAIRGTTLAIAVSLVIASPAGADYEAGQRALEAGDPAEAVRQWRAAASAGDRKAMLALGRIYTQGLGVLQDYAEAHKWFNIAASQGEADAVAERDTLAAKMTPQQVATAQKRAAGWQRDVHQVAGTPDTTTRPNEMSTAIVDAGTLPSPKAVHEAQLLLRALGYRPGPADGIWGARTRKAYQAFLRDVGLPAGDVLTGEASRALRAIAKRQGGGAEAKHSAALGRVPAGANAPGETTVPRGPLHRAAQAGDIERLKAVLGGGVDVNARDARGWTALMHAVDKRHPHLVESLLEAKADPNLRALDGATPLFIAATHGYSGIIEQLMQADADPTIAGPGSQTSSDVARKKYGETDAARERGAALSILALLEGKSLEDTFRQEDDIAYARAQSMDTAESYAEYLRSYPSGRHASHARNREATLTRNAKIVARIVDKSFGGMDNDGFHLTYRFSSNGGIHGVEKTSFFGIPATESCVGSWKISDNGVRYNCDWHNGDNVLGMAELIDNELVCKEEWGGWLAGSRTVRLRPE